ncbi:MAG: hypothetical protein R6V02_11800 [Candidatus Aminicenantes bacterium]
MTQWMTIIDAVSPEIIPQIRAFIIQSERQGAPGLREDSDSFLWDHTLQVAAVTGALSREEKRDPVVPLLTALFHDAGKFTLTGYHRDDIPEEQTAAAAARVILSRLRVYSGMIEKVNASLNALYQEGRQTDPAADIVHDADFLSKFGFQGAAQFFIKSALRGRNLSSAVLSSVSKELTYAAVLPENMRTPAGKKMAHEKKHNTRVFFRGLLKELREAGMADFRIRIHPCPCPCNPDRTLSLHLAEPAECPACGGEFQHCFTTESGLKCRQLNAEISCRSCGHRMSVSFCLPEIPC